MSSDLKRDGFAAAVLLAWATAAVMASGCGMDLKSLSKPANQPQQNQQPAPPPIPPDDGKVDLNGRWIGYGVAKPGEFWSVNFDHKAGLPFAREAEMRCKVELTFKHRADQLEIVEAVITFPETPALSYFRARLTDRVPDSQGNPLIFDPAIFDVREQPAGSGEFNLTQIHAAGAHSSTGFGQLSFVKRELKLNSSGPYIGAYKNDKGNAYTSSRDFKLKWERGKPTLESIELWSYGGSVSHATDAECKGAVLAQVTN